MKKAKAVKILIFGDVFGSLGRRLVQEHLPEIKKKYNPDLVIANAENLTHGSGTSMKTIEELQKAGVDFFTGGNHTFDNAMAKELFADKTQPVIRPANWKDVPGHGYKIIDANGYKILVINLIGQLFMHELFENPFEEVEKLLAGIDQKDISAIIVDFHAEATSETIALGYFLDGQASMVYGTHTHVGTADERILPNGTGFISDVGMTGPYDSIIGMDVNSVVERFRYPEKKVKIKIQEEGKGILNALIVDIDPLTKKCISINKINLIT